VYERFYGLTTRPFALTPDPAFLYLSRQHAMALTLLEYGLESQASIALLTGEIGSGKTTLLRYLLRHMGDQVAVGLISNTHSGFRSIGPWAVSALGIAPADDSEVALTEALVDSFVNEYARGRRTLMIIDEAQNLSVSVLEEIRLLSNVNSEKDLVLQIMLIGQPELRETLSTPALRQFAQRVSVDYHLRPLDSSDTAAYVRHRLAAAGGTVDTFDAASLELIHACAGGVPRLINQLCDVCLVYGFAGGQQQIGADIVTQVLVDRDQAGALPLYRSAPAAAAVAARA